MRGYFEARLHRNITKNQGHPLLGSKFKKPMWKGERNCTVCIFSEKGLGDISIMLRTIPDGIMQKQLKVSIIFEGSGSYLDLVAHNFPNVKCLAQTITISTITCRSCPCRSSAKRGPIACRGMGRIQS